MGPGSSVHDLAIKLPPNSTGGGLFLGNTARRVDVYEDTTQQTNARDGVRIVWGGTLEDSTVTMDRDTTARGVYIGGGGGTIRRSHVGGETGVATAFGPATIQRSTLTGSKYGLRALGGVTRISSSSVHLIGYYGTGIRADVDGQSSDATVFANGVTVTGPYVPDVVAVGADNAFAPSWNAHVNLTNSILRTGGGSLFAYASNLAAGHAGISASYSDYDPAYNLAKGGHASITQANVSNVGNVGFVPGDYRLHLAAGSPLLDRGDPATTQGLDFDGNPLVADGDGDGTARRDLGAFERPAAPGRRKRRRPGRGYAGPADHRVPSQPIRVPHRPREDARGGTDGTRHTPALRPERAGPRPRRNQARRQAQRPHALPQDRHAPANRCGRREPDPLQRPDRAARAASRPLPRGDQGNRRLEQPQRRQDDPPARGAGVTHLN